jgi:hypothetical protein
VKFLKQFALAVAAFLGTGCLGGCHSAFVQAAVINHSGQRVHLFEVDYPSASFGGGELAEGATFRTRFKILGSGTTKILWTDAAEHDHTVVGPDLHEGQEGALVITLTPTGASWDTQLHTH